MLFTLKTLEISSRSFQCLNLSVSLLLPFLACTLTLSNSMISTNQVLSFGNPQESGVDLIHVVPLTTFHHKILSSLRFGYRVCFSFLLHHIYSSNELCYKHKLKIAMDHLAFFTSPYYTFRFFIKFTW